MVAWGVSLSSVEPGGTVIEVQTLVKDYGQLRALDGVSFAVPAGRICGYLGPNGAGKSTTVRILCGLLPPTAGAARVAGFDVERDPFEVKRRVGYVPESGALYGALTPREHLILTCELFGVDPADLHDRVARQLELLDLAEQSDRRIDTLSKGMRQKVLIAAALVHDPEVLLMDEPLNGLDVHSVRAVKDLLREQASRGRAVLYCSHLLDVVERLCDQVVIIERGRILVDTATHELLERFPQATLEDVFHSLTSAAVAEGAE
jgi:ABC-2 type transport system ATP-binding protein